MRSKDIREHLLAKARKYAEAQGISLERIGTKALNDSKFFKGLIDGKGFTVATFDKVVDWIDAQEREREHGATDRSPLGDAEGAGVGYAG